MTTPTQPILAATLFSLLLVACSGSGGASGQEGLDGSAGAARPAPEQAAPETAGAPRAEDEMTTSDATPSRSELATFGAGCFWCVEAVLEQVEGVEDVRSGYMGGQVEDPTYEQVCSGESGHVEVVQLRFDPAVLSYEALLEWFWNLHDPTTRDRQGNDVGPQYRSVVFVHSDEQRAAAERSRAAKGASGAFLAPIVTDIEEASTFWEAEDYHQDYYRGNKSQGYCRFVIAPKLQELGLDH